MLNRKSLLVISLSTLLAGSAFGAGFEKGFMWSGKYAGQAGAAASSVSGAESLYFNPAGLSETKGTELSANFSPTFDVFKGPFIFSTGTQVSSGTKFAPVFGVVGSHALTDKWGVGLGVYVAGGTRAIFDNLDYSSLGIPTASLAPSAKSDLSITEIGLGTGYEVIPGLRVGVGLRTLLVRAALSSPTYIPPGATIPGLGTFTNGGLIATDVTDITATRYNGFKAGIQWGEAGSRFGIGAAWRSTVDFIGKGSLAQKVYNVQTSTLTPLPSANTDVTNSFPQQLNVGAHFDITPRAAPFRAVRLDGILA